MYTPSSAVIRFTLFLLALALYLFVRFVWPARLPMWSKALLTLLVFTAPFYPMITAGLWGGFVSPDAPRWAIVAINAHSGFLMILTAVTVLRDFALLLCFLVRRWSLRDLQRVSGERRTAIGILLGSASLALVGIVEGTRVPRTVSREVALPDLPLEWDGFRIAHLSDIHVSSLFRRDHLKELVAHTNALQADLILITGDLVDGRVPARLEDARPLAELSAPYGVWGCEGNHEHYSDYEGWMGIFPEFGIRILRNEHTLLTRNGSFLGLVGLTDSMAPRFGRAAPDMRAAVSGIPAGVPQILMVHRPGEARRWAAENPAAILQLSGHTHGGQLLSMHWVVARLNAGFVKGFYDVARRAGRAMRLFVHPGSGLWNGFALRLGVPSEITLLTLRSASQNEAK